MKERVEGVGSGDDDLEKYQKHLDRQLAKEKERWDAIKRAKADATAAEPIEMTVEREVEGAGCQRAATEKAQS
jgi:hypothetical protein